MKPQTYAVLRYLKKNRAGLTALDALTRLGTFRLAARVYELREAGYPVKSRSVPISGGGRVSLYWMGK
jgi:hypothetical protein